MTTTEPDIHTTAGKLADLLVLAADPTQDVTAFRGLTHVIRGGELRPVEELRAPPAPPASEGVVETGAP